LKSLFVLSERVQIGISVKTGLQGINLLKEQRENWMPENLRLKE
jgi:hypothetical protein